MSVQPVISGDNYNLIIMRFSELLLARVTPLFISDQFVCTWSRSGSHLLEPMRRPRVGSVATAHAQIVSPGPRRPGRDTTIS